MPDVDVNSGLSAQLMQFAPLVKSVLDRLKPVVDQPVIRFPYTMPNTRPLVVGPGVSGARFPDTDFSHALEWPFEVHYVKPTQDPAHTFQDWRLQVRDQTFNQDWHKTMQLVQTLVEDNTGVWRLGFPWTVRPKGGGLVVTVDNLDTVNPITVNISFVGFLLIPRV